MIDFAKYHQKLLVTIVNKGQGSRVVRAGKRAGAEGGTIIQGKGTGIHETKTFLGISIEPEKEIVLIVVPETEADRTLTTITKALKLGKPGKGIAFVVDVAALTGAAHLL